MLSLILTEVGVMLSLILTEVGGMLSADINRGWGNVVC